MTISMSRDDYGQLLTISTYKSQKGHDFILGMVL